MYIYNIAYIYIQHYVYTYVSTKPYSDITYKATNIPNLQLAHSQSSQATGFPQVPPLLQCIKTFQLLGLQPGHRLKTARGDGRFFFELRDEKD
jgi:hypothetical protein